MPPRGRPNLVPCPHKQAKKRTRDDLKEAQRVLNAAQYEVDRLEKIPRVSEHAMLRYCERVRGIDTVQFCKDMLPKEAIDYLANARSANFNMLIRGIDDDYVLLVEGPYITSIWRPEQTKEGSSPREFCFTANEAWRRICLRPTAHSRTSAYSKQNT